MVLNCAFNMVANNAGHCKHAGFSGMPKYGIQHTMMKQVHCAQWIMKSLLQVSDPSILNSQQAYLIRDRLQALIGI
jgi:hypothetical protein